MLFLFYGVDDGLRLLPGARPSSRMAFSSTYFQVN